jgi:uroporphyrinogen decarboxylase
MTGRERFQAAFAFEEADRVPFEVAATAASEIEPEARARLLEHLGLKPRNDQAGLDELLDLLEPDLGRVRLGGTALWPSGRLELDLDALQRATLRQREKGRAVVLDTEFGLVDGCQRLRGLTGWLEDLLAAPAAADALMEKVTAACVGVLRVALRSLGDLIDAVVVYEDLAGQTRTMVSPELYQQRIKSFHAQLVETIHSESAAKAVLHCDGAVGALLRDFAEIGVDAINPVQTSARGMEPRRLKRAFGRKLILWGGFDAPEVFAFGTPQDATREAARTLAALTPGGGYVLAPAYPIEVNVPPENVLAFVETARRHSSHSRR